MSSECSVYAPFKGSDCNSCDVHQIEERKILNESDRFCHQDSQVFDEVHSHADDEITSCSAAELVSNSYEACGTVNTTPSVTSIKGCGTRKSKSALPTSRQFPGIPTGSIGLDQPENSRLQLQVNMSNNGSDQMNLAFDESEKSAGYSDPHSGISSLLTLPHGTGTPYSVQEECSSQFCQNSILTGGLLLLSPAAQTDEVLLPGAMSPQPELSVSAFP